MQPAIVDRIEDMYVKHQADPYPVYREWRDKGPVVVDADGKVIVLGHDDARAALADPAVSVDPRDSRWYQQRAAAGEVSAEEEQRYADAPFIELNPPEHTRHRLLVGQAFAAHAARAAEPTAQVVDALLDRLAGGTGCDVVREYAYAIPIRVLCALFGIADEDDRQRVQDWSHFISRSMDPSNPVDPAEVDRVSGELRGYLERLVDARAAEPGDDVVSAMLASRGGDQRLTRAEVVNGLWLLVVSGHETTSSLIASGLYSLLTEPALADRMRAEPEKMPGLVDELLRLTPLVQCLWRHVKQDTTLPSGARLRAGDSMVIVLAQANRDPERFTDPDRLDPDRTEQHLSFGAGPHYCLGATLGRLQANLALSAFLRRVEAPELAVEPAGTPRALGGLTSLPIRYQRVLPAD
ncbi:cytochrome P450 [Micromonospora echinaurantiaca]|uniref:cytochrome P450 n=1 Tax=Micromonospora echinaurantiaca TaxID=47857 RepID=UPI003719ACDE